MTGALFEIPLPPFGPPAFLAPRAVRRPRARPGDSAPDRAGDTTTP
ncbi:hypothetical protein [Streptomyces sp. NPDC088731]